jgi:pimeloyl-ACP methyl ester carboxylesterase
MDRGQSFRKVERRLVDLDLTVYDRRGYGASSAAGTATSIAEHVEDLLVVLDGRPTVVVGHSLGAVVALAAAASRPGTVVAVMAYEAPLPWEPWWPRDSAGGRAVGAHLDDPPAAAEAFMRTMVGDRSWERLPASTRAARRAEGRALLAEMTAIRRPPAPLDLRRVAVPVLSARGAASAPHHRRAAEVVATGVAHGELAEIAGADHGAHLTHPDEFAALVRRTVAAVPGRRRSSP